MKRALRFAVYLATWPAVLIGGVVIVVANAYMLGQHYATKFLRWAFNADKNALETARKMFPGADVRLNADGSVAVYKAGEEPQKH